MSNRPEAFIGTGLTPQRSVSVVEAARSARLHAVPVQQIVSSSGWLAEAIYRCFEIAAALIGFILGLPLMLIAAAVICLDSPGPPLFFHKRPGRSVMVRGRELSNRTDLQPPPGGYKPDTFYYVPTYFTMIKLRTMF